MGGTGVTRPSGINRPTDGLNRPGIDGTRPGTGINRPGLDNRPGINGTRPGIGACSGRGNCNAIINRPININNVNLRPGWVGAGYGWAGARPWGWGWYGGGGWYGGWGWWGANAALWGLTTLTSAAIIGSAVNSAISSNTSYIAVPNSTYQLLYGSVQPQDANNISFAFTYQGQTYQANADCRNGYLNGSPPGAPAEAELMNAACQVAFGSF